MERIERVNRTFLFTVLAALSGSVLIGAIPMLKERPLWRLLFSQVIYAAPVFCYLASSRESPIQVLRIRKLSWSSIWRLILFSYCIMPLLSFLNTISMLFVSNRISNLVHQINSGYSLPMTLLCVAFVPAALEEIAYRGVFFRAYRDQNPKAAIVLSGLLFGLLHMNWNQFFYAAVMGMIFACLAEANGSLLASMLVHFIINATSTVIDRYSAVSTETLPMEHGTLLRMAAVLGILSIASTAAAFTLLKGMAKNAGGIKLFGETAKEKHTRCRGSDDETTLITPALSAAMMVCFLLMVYTEFAVGGR